MHGFNYEEAFSRNRGPLGERDQEALRRSCVAVAGLGGAGGAALMALVRLGVGRFRIADFDRFELDSFNRQIGAGLHSLGRPKVEVMAAMARAVNPEIDLVPFDEVIRPENAGDFLEGAHLVVDGLDFFHLGDRRELIRCARERGLYAISIGPIGFTAILQIFSPTGMSFDDYFALQEGGPEDEKLRSWLAGLVPDVPLPGRLESVPALSPATEIGAALAAAQAVRLLAGRKPATVVPRCFQVDACTLRVRQGVLPGGGRHPLRRWRLTRARGRRRDLPILTSMPNFEDSLYQESLHANRSDSPSDRVRASVPLWRHGTGGIPPD